MEKIMKKIISLGSIFLLFIPLYNCFAEINMVGILYRIDFTKGCVRTVVGITNTCLCLLLYTFGFQSNPGEFKGIVQLNASDGTYRITGGGKNIFGNTDKFYYVWNRVDGELTLKETPVFSNVNFETFGVIAQEERVLESTLEIIDVETGERRIVHRAKEHFEAPNWSRDGKTLIYNSKGSLYTIPVTGGQPRLLNTGFANRCNNDHGLSPDGKQLAISHAPEKQSLIYILPSSGGEPRLITELGPSYWHGWSPDGKTLVYCASRNGEFDIYRIPVQGGKEKRLTYAKGLDDGPDYSPDGKFIFFNSVRTGQMKIWRMKTDGSEQVQMTLNDNYNDWFPHPSPDGKWLVFISYDKSVQGHPPNKNVVLRIMPMSGGEPRVLTSLFGGQGTINVPSWSPDSKWVAFVSYRLVAPYK